MECTKRRWDGALITVPLATARAEHTGAEQLIKNALCGLVICLSNCYGQARLSPFVGMPQ